MQIATKPKKWFGFTIIFKQVFDSRAINRYKRFRRVIGIRVLTCAHKIRTFTQDILFSPVSLIAE